MHSRGMKRFENYRNSVTRLSTTLTMAEATYSGRLTGGATSTTPQKAGSVAGGEGVR